MIELKPCDVKRMLSFDEPPVTLVLEGSHVGRGNKWQVLVEIDMAQFISSFNKQ